MYLTRRESDRDRYGYTHPSPTVDLHTGKGFPDSRTFFVHAAKWRARARLDVYGSVNPNRPSSLGYLERKREDEGNNHLRGKKGKKRERNSNLIIVTVQKNTWDT